MKIGILYICTGKYTVFWKDFYLSCEKYFAPETEKHYFVFTDALELDFTEDNSKIHKIYQKNLGWPNNTLMRFDIFLKYESDIDKMDYLYFMNANLLCVYPVPVGEIIPKNNLPLVATLHPGYFNKDRKQFTYESTSTSTAYVPFNKGKYYVAGGFNGGKSSDFIIAMKEMSKNIAKDAQNNITAIWHDESHWNKYILERNDATVLSPSYLYPENWILPFTPKIIVRDKNKYGGHDFIRKPSNT